MFLVRQVAPAKVLVVSEESRATWAERLQRMPVGPHWRLMPPFPRRPSPDAWNARVDHAIDLLTAGELDLMVTDSHAKFLPGSSESDKGAVLKMLDPLQRLTEWGAGVTILHHPRNKPSVEANHASQRELS